MDNKGRSLSLDVNMLHSKKLAKTPLIQVTQVLHPDDKEDDEHIMSPRHLSRGDIPTIGIDNLSYVHDEDDPRQDSEYINYERELRDIHTPLPTPFSFASRRGSNLSMFAFETDCTGLFSRRGSYLLERRRHSAGQTLVDKSCLTVPSLKHRNLEVPLEGPSMIWSTLMKAFWRGDATKRRYESVKVITSSCTSDDDEFDDDIDDGIPLRELRDRDVHRPLLSRETELRPHDLYDSNALQPGFTEQLDHHIHPPPSPGMLSTHSTWSELLNIDASRRSSEAGQSDMSRLSNVSSSLSEHLRYLVRAFSSRTEKVKEATLQPPSPSSVSDDYAASDAMSAISAEPQFRHRLDSFLPDQPEGDTISEIVRIRNENEEEERKKHRLPRWIRRLKFPHVIEPHSILYLLWLFIVTLAFMYNAWAIPLRAAFPYQTPENVKYWLACDYVCDFIYLVDILLFKMRISFLNSGLKETHRSKTRANYMKKPMFKFDCLSLLPLDLLYLIEMKVNPWCRLPRVLKIQTFWEFYSRCDHLVRSAHAVRIMRTFTYMLFLIHLETCGYYAMSVYEGIGTNDWVYNGKGNAYIRCFYLATKTATSIGNNPRPGNTNEYLFMTVYWVSGVFVFALLIGQIRDIFDASNMVKTTYTHKMDSALYYVKNMNLPKETQDRVRTWFIYNWGQQKGIDETTMMDALPLKLRKDLAIHVHFNTLSKVKLFSDCDKTLLYDLVLKLKPILYLPGDYVCKKGEIGKEMYIVSQGIVEVVGGPNNSLVLATLREGSVFGEISLLAIAAEGNRRTADVRCKGFTNLFILSKTDFENAMKDYPEAYKLLKKRAKKLLRMNARIERQSQSSVDQTKINIIHTPPETPKMVKTVIQIMDPGSSFVRRLSNRSSRLPSDVPSSGADVAAEGTDNGAFDHRLSVDYNIDDAKEVDSVEVFYDNMLAGRDWNEEISALEREYEDRNSVEEVNKTTDMVLDNDKQKPGDCDGDNDDDVDDKQEKKKNSNTSSSSADSGVQDTKVTSPSSSTARSISNKDSKESCFSAELGDIVEDPGETDVDKVQYTADMFGDIESQSIRPKSSNNNRNVKSYKYNNCKGGGSALLRNDEYAKSFANGFTIIIDPAAADEGNRSPTFSDSGDSMPDDVLENIDEQLETENKAVSKSVSFSSECKTNNEDTVVENTKMDDDSSESKIFDHKKQNNTTTAMNTSNGKRKPLSAGKNKIGIQTKNKLGLQLKIENEKATSFAPYTKSNAGKTKSVTNRTRQQHGLSRQKNNKVDTVNEMPKIKSDISKPTRKISRVENINEQDMARRTSSACSTRSISVAEAPEGDTVDNITDTTEQNKITCYADVHREKTLSPRSNNEEMSTLCTSDISSPARQRKISVISIGSVLKDGRETLV